MSGAGKSTLVRSINMLERPTSGKIVIDGRDMAALSEAELRAARRDITMIFQGFNLLMQRTCQRNVAFPLELAGMKRGDAMKRAAELLELVGLGDKLKNYPSQLSGGQQQRVAIARAPRHEAEDPPLRRGHQRARPAEHPVHPRPHPRHSRPSRHHRHRHHAPDERRRADLHARRHSRRRRGRRRGQGQRGLCRAAVTGGQAPRLS